MKNLLLFAGCLSLFFGLGSCDKTRNCECTAYDSSGMALYEVKGKTICEDQLVNEGDYCDCSCPN